MEKKSISISIKDIQEASLSTKILSKDFISENLSGELNFIFTTNEKENLLIITPTVGYIYNDGESKTDILRYTIKMIFEVSNLDAGLSDSENNLRLPTELVMMALNITLSTLRGMIAVRTIGQPHPFIMPIFNMQDLVKGIFPNDQIPIVPEGE